MYKKYKKTRNYLYYIIKNYKKHKIKLFLVSLLDHVINAILNDECGWTFFDHYHCYYKKEDYEEKIESYLLIDSSTIIDVYVRIDNIKHLT